MNDRNDATTAAPDVAPAPKRRPIFGLVSHVPAVLVLLVLLTVTAFSGLAARRIVHDEEARLLDQRTTELGATLASSFNGLRATLEAVGQVALRDGIQAQDLTSIAGKAVSPASSLTVLQRSGAGYRRVAGIHDQSPARTLPTGSEQQVADRALAAADLVTSIVTDPAGAHLLVGLKIAIPTPTVVVLDSPIQRSRTVPTSASSPYRDLNVVVYLSEVANPASLLLVSGAQPSPGTGPVDRRLVTVGAQSWLVITGPRGELVGSFASNFPWTVIVCGLVLSLVIATLIEVLARRRSYAYNLVRQRTTDLQQAQQAAEQANLAKSAFLSRMSHELRTPLNAVLGFSQLLEMDQLTPDQKDSVNQITKGGRHLLDLVNEVLDISHIESGKLSLSPEAVYVGDLIEETIALMQPLAQQRSIHLLKPDASGCDTFIFADRQRSKQILLNLLSNAVKYNRQGGSICLHCEQLPNGHLRIGVTDTGPGIPESQLPLLFLPFERLGAEHTTIEGTGIGLALSHKLALAMGGTLTVHSTVGTGSTFWLEFPLVEGPLHRYDRLNPHTEQPIPIDPGHTRSKILYIEDNLANLQLVERVVSQRPDVELVAAMQGRLGLELAREHKPLLILLDLNLADLPGEEILHQLRDDPDTTAIPVVIVSADAMPRQAQRLKAAGAANYLTKPIDITQLLSIIDDALYSNPELRPT